IDGAVVEAAVAAAVADHEQRRRLLAALVAARLVAGLQRRQDAPGEWAFRLLERRRHRGDDLLAGQEVALAGVVLARPGAGPRHALRAGEVRRVAGGVHDADLADVLLPVVLGQRPDHVRGRLAAGQQLQAARAVGGVGVALRGDRPGV